MSVKDHTINNRAKVQIAGKLLGLQPGDRLPVIVQLTEELEVSRGTVQNVLGQLVEDRAIQIEVRGHLGSFLTAKDDGKLLAAVGINSIYFSMPVPYSRRYEGLASGLYQAMFSLAVPGGTFFISGSERRLNSLLEKRVDAAVMSEMAAENYIRDGAPVEMLHVFGDYTYISSHHLITRRGFDLNGRDSVVLGMDYASSDQSYWVKKIFTDKKVRTVPIQYMHAVERIIDGTIDACVWSIEDLHKYEGIEARELCYTDGEGHPDRRNTRAAILVRRDDQGMKNYLRSALNFSEIARTQEMVVTGKALPEY